MTSYRTYYMNADDHFSAILELAFQDDDAAMADAEVRLKDHYAMEVFCEGRRVGRVESEAARSAARGPSLGAA